jgi:hypothetical protein
MEDFGVKSGMNKGKIRVEPQTYQPVKFYSRVRLSAASYWYQILALKGEGQNFSSRIGKR